MAKLYFYYAAMNAGKSTTLLQSSYNYHERGMQTLLFTAAIDNRYDVGSITSRIGLSEHALIFKAADDVLLMTQQVIAKGQKLACVLVDEAHFLSKAQVHQLSEITDTLNIPVLAYGLRTDFRSELFPGSLALLAIADELIELKTICHCGRKAIMNMRIDAKGNAVTEGSQVMIGGNESYTSTCRKHFKLGDSGIKKTSKVVAKEPECC